MSSENDNNVNQNSKNKLIILLVILLFIVVVALVAVIAFAFGKKNSSETSPQQTESNTQGQTGKQREVLVTEENVQEVIEEMKKEEQYTPPGYYTVTQNYTWHFPSGKEASTDAHVGNDAGNTNDVYFDLFLAENEEDPIYMSPVIPIGASLEDFKLDTELEAGTYDCIMVYHLCDENQNSLSTVSMTVTVIVEK